MNNRLINYTAFTILTILWLGFISALLINQSALDTAWQTFLGWPIIVKLLVGIFVLPVAVGLWIWETTWPLLLRLVLVIGLAWVTIYTFFPRKTAGRPAAELKQS